jgi:hypothetical protein
MHAKFWLDSLKGGDHSENLGIDGRTILRWILGKYGWWVWNEFNWTSSGFCKEVKNLWVL